MTVEVVNLSQWSSCMYLYRLEDIVLYFDSEYSRAIWSQCFGVLEISPDMLLESQSHPVRGYIPLKMLMESWSMSNRASNLALAHIYQSFWINSCTTMHQPDIAAPFQWWFIQVPKNHPEFHCIPLIIVLSHCCFIPWFSNMCYLISAISLNNIKIYLKLLDCISPWYQILSHISNSC